MPLVDASPDEALPDDPPPVEAPARSALARPDEDALNLRCAAWLAEAA